MAADRGSADWLARLGGERAAASATTAAAASARRRARRRPRRRARGGERDDGRGGERAAASATTAAAGADAAGAPCVVLTCPAPTPGAAAVDAALLEGRFTGGASAPVRIEAWRRAAATRFDAYLTFHASAAKGWLHGRAREGAADFERALEAARRPPR